jgi:uncharacterized membrane protein
VAFALMTLTTIAAIVFAMRYDSQAIAVLGLLGGYITPVALSTGEDHPWILFSYTFLLNLCGLTLSRLRRWRAVEGVSFAATLFLFFGWAVSHFRDSTRIVATVFTVVFYIQFAISSSRTIWWLTQLLASLAAAFLWEQPARFLGLDLFFGLGGLTIAEVRREYAEAPPWTLACYWLAYWVWRGSSSSTTNAAETFLWFSVAFAAFFLWIIWWSLVRRREPREADLFTMAANGAAYFGAAYVLLNPAYHSYMGLLAVALGAVHLAVARVLWKPAPAGGRASIPSILALGVTLSFLTLAIPIQFTGFRITVAWALEGVVLAWLAARFDNFRLRVAAWTVFLLVLFRLYTFDAWIYSTGRQFPAIVNARFLTFVVAALALWLGAKFARAYRWAAAGQYIAGHFVMLWILSAEVIGWAERSKPPADQWSVETTSISILMAVYSLMLVAIGVGSRTALNRVLGLGLMGLVVLKLYLLDVWSLGRVFRITAFLALGGLLLVVSYLYSRFRPMIERLWNDDSGS